MIRAAEVKTIKQYAVVSSMLNVTFTIVPLLVTLATFAVYIYTDPENNKLSAEKVFSCIAIYNVLRTPLYMFPMYFMETARLMVSVRRLSQFLDSPEIDSEYITYQPNQTPALKMSSASFVWEEGQQEHCTLTDLNITIERGSLTAIVGEVGSGKVP